ncbi:hypothetical protein LAZ67_13000733 [Cordylochernes scorpioides]|uniref:Reverse transcriptase Ty1/copia-type domain-containing protein n=1 Tax=Cordylochernes scorpioides TaxID=51811 RepID=A0ABY6L3P8_9ARAC|nr:hypothetical protein LAZ67_13000733 [Cordylochernes scorpioides]
MNLHDSENWIGAMKKELGSQREHKFGHFNLFPKALNKWIYTIKKDATTQDRKYKARLVATGYQQSYGQDYEYIFSPVIKNDSLRVILAFAAIMQYDIKCFDIVAAYLYGNLEETIYMKQPEGFEVSDNSLVCKLNQAIYSLKQSVVGGTSDISSEENTEIYSCHDSEFELESENEEFGSSSTPSFYVGRYQTTRWKTSEWQRIRGNFSRERDAKDTNDVEIWAQIGLLLLSGTNKACHLSFQEIWADDGTGFKIFRSVMNRERFLFLLRCLRFDDLPTLDEKIIPFKGRCSFKQYFPNKPAKYGIETVVFST